MAMANNEEITLNPPNILAYSEQPRISNEGPGLAHKTLADFRILQPDNTLHAFQLPVKSTGQDCIDQICGILGIVEKDYFGLQYREKTCGHMIWINKRHQVRKQIVTRPPYLLHFSVKYYTPPSNILQSSTIDAFFVELKSQIRKGNLHIPNSKKGLVGARIAQADEGDYMDTTCMVYPPYFPSWNSGIAHIIRKEHRKMKGIKKREAQVIFIQTVYELENYGVTYVRGILGGEKIILGIGAKYIRIFKRDWRLKYRISFSSLVQVAFGNKFFSFTHCLRDDERNLVEKKVTVYVYSYILARSIFRSVTEDQVFHYQVTVSQMVLNHSDNSVNMWKSFCKKVLRRKYGKKYYYDIRRTRREAYRHYWQILNQVASDEVVTEPPEEPPVIYVNLPNNNPEEEEEEDAEKLKKKCEVYWGLSDSTVNLAKLLLPPEYINVTPSKELSLIGTELNASNAVEECTSKFDPWNSGGDGGNGVGDTSNDGEDIDGETRLLIPKNVPKPLSKAQGRKMFHFLMKIQDEKLCNVCMDELISTVFCPCGHYVACQRCAKRLDKCPVCRQPIGYAQFVYTK